MGWHILPPLSWHAFLWQEPNKPRAIQVAFASALAPPSSSARHSEVILVGGACAFAFVLFSAWLSGWLHVRVFLFSPVLFLCRLACAFFLAGLVCGKQGGKSRCRARPRTSRVRKHPRQRAAALKFVCTVRLGLLVFGVLDHLGCGAWSSRLPLYLRVGVSRGARRRC